MPNPAAIWEDLTIPAFGLAWATDLVHEFLRPGDHVLDLACGTGIVARCARHHLKHYARIVALDRSEDMLDMARLCAPHGVEWKRGDASRLPFTNAEFHVVLCQQGFQLFENKPRVLQEIRRVLKPAGRLALTVWRSAEHAPPFAAMERLMAELLDDPGFRLPPFAWDRPEELRSLLEEAGFVDVEMRKETKPTHLPSFQTLVDMVLVAYQSIFPVKTFDEVERGRFMVAARDVLRPYTDAESGEVEFPQTAHVASAKAPGTPESDY